MSGDLLTSKERAVRVLLKWHVNSSKVRVTLATDNMFITCHGHVYRVDEPSWIWCVGDEVGDEIRFNLERALSVALTNSNDVPTRLKFSTAAIDEFVSITWADGTRLNLVTEKQTCPTI